MFKLEIWGIDENGSFKSNKNNRDTFSLFHKLVSNQKECVADVILSELKQINKSLINEKKIFTDPDMKDSEKGRRLLFLFQCDLLPGIKGQLLESKGERPCDHKALVEDAAK